MYNMMHEFAICCNKNKFDPLVVCDNITVKIMVQKQLEKMKPWSTRRGIVGEESKLGGSTSA